MSNYFFDSSALVKRYIPEVGTAWVRSTMDRRVANTSLIAHITQVKIISAVMRRSRDSSIAPRTAKAIYLVLNRHASQHYSVIALTPVIVALANSLVPILCELMTLFNWHQRWKVIPDWWQQDWHR